MIPIRPATPVGIAPHHDRSPLAFVGICLYCFKVLGKPRSMAERRDLEAKHVCAEKLQARQPATPAPFN